MAILSDELAWMRDGRCWGLDPNLFFPERGEPTAPAKAVCAECPLEMRCRDFGIETNQRHGIFGGLTEGERRKLRRRRLAETA